MTLREALQRVEIAMGDPYGQCYYACEAVYHLVGGKQLQSAVMPAPEGSGFRTHWFLLDAAGNVIDPTIAQFHVAPDYTEGRRCGFLTTHPSKGALRLMQAARAA